MREVPEASPPPPNRRPLGVQLARARVRHGGGPVFPPFHRAAASVHRAPGPRTARSRGARCQTAGGDR